MHSRTIQCKLTACAPTLIKLGKGRDFYERARSPAPHVARGRKTLQMRGFPIQTYGEILNSRNFNSKV